MYLRTDYAITVEIRITCQQKTNSELSRCKRMPAVYIRPTTLSAGLAESDDINLEDLNIATVNVLIDRFVLYNLRSVRRHGFMFLGGSDYRSRGYTKTRSADRMSFLTFMSTSYIPTF